jgi:hypothetical protein
MRHTRHLLTLLPLLAVGCRYPEDPLFTYGRVLHADGSPRANATVTIERAPPRYMELEEDEDAPEKPPAFKPYGTATTQADGEFTHQFLYGDVEELDEYGAPSIQYRFRMSVPQENGEGTFVSFVFSGDVELPAIQPWEARFTVADSPAGPALSFSPAPAAAELPPTAKERTVYFGNQIESQVAVPATTPEPIVQLFAGGERLWRQSGVKSPWAPGPYVLEDFAQPEAQLRAVSLGDWLFSPLGSPSSLVGFRQEWRTPRLPLASGALRPVSRGASCEPSPQEGCPWTDGQLTPVPFFTDDFDEAPYAFTLTLAEPKRLSRAVIRGLEYGHVFIGTERLRLEGSVDGEHWLPLATAVVRQLDRRKATLEGINESFADNTAWDSPFDGKLELYDRVPVYVDLPLETPEPVRHVRLQVEAEGEEKSIRFLRSLAELSLFE